MAHPFAQDSPLRAKHKGDTHTSAAVSEQHQRARMLVLQHGWNAMAYQILNPGIAWWFAADGQAVVGYVATHGYRVVAGAPICAPEQLGAVAAAFEADAKRYGQCVCYFGAGERLSELLSAHGLEAQLLLGAQPVWHPAEWDAIIRSKASLRAQIARARNKHVKVMAWPAAHATDHHALRRVLHEWLRERGLPPMHFMVEPDTLSHLEDRHVFVATHDDRVVGFLVASPVPMRRGWLVEQMIRGAGAPNGTVELLLDTAVRAMAADGAHYVTLGLSPLSQHGGSNSHQSLPTRLLLAMTRIHGRRFYNFAGLDTFKAKFQPAYWEPIYAISNERATSLRTIYVVAAAFGGRSPILFVGAALLRAAVQELRWSRAGWRRRRRGGVMKG